MNRQAHRIYRLDGVEIDTSQLCLKRDGKEQHLRQKTFQVFIYVLERRERLITKDELIEHIWEGAAVTDNTLEQCMTQIRKVLRDDSRHPRFIKTMPRAGYRFIGEVEEIEPTSLATRGVMPESEIGEFSQPRTTQAAWFSSRLALIAGAVLLIAAAALEDCLANAFLELDRLDEAITEYQRILKLNPNYPLVHYHLAQAYERKGLRDQGRTQYERFLQVWKDADTDVPEIIKARKALSS